MDKSVNSGDKRQEIWLIFVLLVLLFVDNVNVANLGRTIITHV